MLNFLKFLTNYYWLFVILAIFFGISLIGYTKKEKKDADGSNNNNVASASNPEEMVISSSNE